MLVVVAVKGSGSGEPKVWSYTVPPGTGARIEAGEQLYVFPARLDVHVGDELVIRNDDVRVAQVGPYLVDRNSTLTQTFTRTGIIQGFCSIHPSGRVTIEIHD
jgi:plastocyanin